MASNMAIDSKGAEKRSQKDTQYCPLSSGISSFSSIMLMMLLLFLNICWRFFVDQDPRVVRLQCVNWSKPPELIGDLDDTGLCWVALIHEVMLDPEILKVQTGR